MTYEKLKGIVKEAALRKLLDKAEEMWWIPKTNDCTFWNGKSLFVVRRKSVKYWNIFQVMGNG